MGPLHSPRILNSRIINRLHSKRDWRTAILHEELPECQLCAAPRVQARASAYRCIRAPTGTPSRFRARRPPPSRVPAPLSSAAGGSQTCSRGTPTANVRDRHTDTAASESFSATGGKRLVLLRPFLYQEVPRDLDFATWLIAAAVIRVSLAAPGVPLQAQDPTDCQLLRSVKVPPIFIVPLQNRHPQDVAVVPESSTERQRLDPYAAGFVRQRLEVPIRVLAKRWESTASDQFLGHCVSPDRFGTHHRVGGALVTSKDADSGFENTMQKMYAVVEGAICHVLLPTPDSQLLGGIRWGSFDELLTPAYWKGQAWQHERLGTYDDFRLGRSLTEELAACLLGGYGMPAELGLAAYRRVRDRGLLATVPAITEVESALSEPFMTPQGPKRHYRFPRQKARYLAASPQGGARDRPAPERPRPARPADEITRSRAENSFVGRSKPPRVRRRGDHRRSHPQSRTPRWTLPGRLGIPTGTTSS